MFRNMGFFFRRKCRNGWWLNIYNSHFYERDLLLVIIIRYTYFIMNPLKAAIIMYNLVVYQMSHLLLLNKIPGFTPIFG
jgi:hypothetical protein